MYFYDTFSRQSIGLMMLKFKKSGVTPSTPPPLSPISQPWRPKLLTRLDSLTDSIDHDRLSIFGECQKKSLIESSSGSSISSNEFDKANSKIRDYTKKKLNEEKKRLAKINEKKEKNLISSKDFFSRLQDLKIWITEMGYGDVNTMNEDKLKDLFKKFVKKWNKKKLPKKYYKGVDLYSSPLLHPEELTVESTGYEQHEVTRQDVGENNESSEPVCEETKSVTNDSNGTCASFNQRFATVGKASPSKYRSFKVKSQRTTTESLACSPTSTKSKSSACSPVVIPKLPPKPPARRIASLLSKKLHHSESSTDRCVSAVTSNLDYTVVSGHIKATCSESSHLFSKERISPSKTSVQQTPFSAEKDGEVHSNHDSEDKVAGDNPADNPTTASQCDANVSVSNVILQHLHENAETSVTRPSLKRRSEELRSDSKRSYENSSDPTECFSKKVSSEDVNPAKRKTKWSDEIENYPEIFL